MVRRTERPLSAICMARPRGAPQTASPFDPLLVAREQRRRYGESERLGGLRLITIRIAWAHAGEDRPRTRDQ